MLGHESFINCISISADGRRIASGGLDGTVRIWDLETRLQVGDSFHVDGLVDSVAFSPDGRHIINSRFNGEVWLWDTASFASQGASSPPTASDQNSPVRGRARSLTSSVLDLPAVPEPIVPHRDNSSLSESEYSCGSLFDSILDVPAPGQQRPNKKRPHSTESIGRHLRHHGLQQDSPREQETSTIQPAVSAEVSFGRKAAISFCFNATSNFPPRCSLPITSARNAPKVQDRTHSVTFSMLNLPSIQQGMHQAISRFCNTLSSPQISVSLAETPNDWLRANSSQILQVPSIHGKERAEVDLIYPRFFVYALEFLERYMPSEVESLKAKYIEWTNNVDEITQLINHESIKVTLDRYLTRRETEFQLNDPAIVDKILKLDALCIVARILAMLKEPQRRTLLLGQTGPQAQSLLDLIQKLLDSFDLVNVRSFFVKILVELSKRSGLYPQRVLLPTIDIQGDQVDGGAFGDVFKGDLDGRAVAVKKMRVFVPHDVYAKEAVLWAQLSSPYVLPFCGVYCTNEPSPRACLVSPWMDDGDLSQYLEDNPQADRLQLMLDVALGLDYLHSFSLPVIHGDLKGPNILITSGLRACIADFGLSIIAEDSDLYFTATATSNGQGSIPWMAPELLIPDPINPERRRKSCASDIYAFGRVGYEIYAGRPPFSEFAPMMSIMRKLQLRRPAITELDDAIWELIEKCRRTDPASRPDAGEVVRQLRCHPGTRDYELAPLSVWHQKKSAT
ncbi:kinase-like protein [Leucogyrophana mollusca]|uniref:Kinase-like protein n=1 Tax=Leucogyrophana mollusca TaxID=85980 RepID=A0ACB8BML6_9AGAM|nr:kinase-like protein [Leucogyrophana mollusca]